MHRKCTENAREPGGSKPRSRPSGIPAAKRPALSTLTYPLDLRQGSTRRNVKGRVKVRVDRSVLFRQPSRLRDRRPDERSCRPRHPAAPSGTQTPVEPKVCRRGPVGGSNPRTATAQRQPSDSPSDSQVRRFRSLSTRRFTVLNCLPGVRSIDASRVRSSVRRVD